MTDNQLLATPDPHSDRDLYQHYATVEQPNGWPDSRILRYRRAYHLRQQRLQGFRAAKQQLKEAQERGDAKEIAACKGRLGTARTASLGALRHLHYLDTVDQSVLDAQERREAEFQAAFGPIGQSRTGFRFRDAYSRAQREGWPAEQIQRLHRRWKEWTASEEELNADARRLVDIGKARGVDAIDLRAWRAALARADVDAARQAAIERGSDVAEAYAAFLDAKRRNTNAAKNLRNAENPERAKLRRIPQKVRREVLAEWEAGGRVCCICKQVVGPDARIQVHHLMPVACGGSSQKRNLGVAHTSCNEHTDFGGFPIRSEHYAALQHRSRRLADLRNGPI